MHPEPGSSPARRFEQVAKHSDLTPGIAKAAERVADMEMDALRNERIGDALFKEEAKDCMHEILSTLDLRRKKRVHAAVSPVVAVLEAQWLDKRARVAAKKHKKAVPVPRKVTRLVRDPVGKRI